MSVFRGLEAGLLVVVISVFCLCGILAAYLLFTLLPPGEPDVFLDPVTNRCGFDGHLGLADGGDGDTGGDMDDTGGDTDDTGDIVAAG